MEGRADGLGTPFWSESSRRVDGVDRLDMEGLTVLTVDDEPEIVSLYAAWFTPECTVRTAQTGRDALDRFDERVDVVLIDRTLPDLSGDEVLRSVAGRDGDQCVVVISAVEPDVDVVDLPFDVYLTKPVDRKTLLGTVEWVHRHDRRPSAVAAYLTLDHKVTLLERSAVTTELDSDSAFRRLRERRDDAKRRVQRRVESVSGQSGRAESGGRVGE